MVTMMGWGVPEQGWRKGPWTPEEDKSLSEYVKLHGEGRWSSVARCVGKFSVARREAGLNRTGKSCRLRWVNYLRPGLKRGQLTPQEEGIIIELHALWGNKWSTIARYLPGRTDNEIKNYWRTHFKKKEKSSQKQERRKAQIPKQKELQQKQQQRQQQEDVMNMANPTDEKMQEEQGKQEMVLMYPTLEDQCLPMVSHDVASWANSVVEDIDGLWLGLWNLDDTDPQGHVNHTSNSNEIAMQNQATAFSFGRDSNNVYNGEYIF